MTMHDSSHDMKRWRTLCEAAKKKNTPAQLYLAMIKTDKRCSHCELEADEYDPRQVNLIWLEGSGGLVPYLTQVADTLGVKLTLMVEVIDTAYGGRLVRYYEKNGFVIKNSDFDDDFDFMHMKPNQKDELQGQVYMEREPSK